MWIFWYDRQGPIQTRGFNFVESLPHFIVVLFIYQRFDLRQWGFIPELLSQSTREKLLRGPGTSSDLKLSASNLDDDVPVPKVSSVTRDESEPKSFTIEPSKILHQRYNLIGRATRFLGARENTGGPDGQDLKLVAKVSWPEKTRPNEAHNIRKAWEIAERLENCEPERQSFHRIADHLPVVHHDCEFDKYETYKIRKAVRAHTAKSHDDGLKGLVFDQEYDGSSGSRILRILILTELSPVEASRSKANALKEANLQDLTQQWINLVFGEFRQDIMGGEG
jgi:hypothetical protein